MLLPILYATLALNGTAGPPAAPARALPALTPHIEVWLNNEDVYHRGDRAHVYFQTDEDAYITIFRVDTDGRVRVLFPVDPWEDNYARGGHRYDVAAREDDYAFRIDDYPGEGYVFAIASADPFNYASYVRGDHWDYRAIATQGRVTGDPYVALGDLINQIVPANYVDYTYDVASYYVEEHYSYPRFVCYNCHAYAAYPYWDPYATPCIRYRVVIYNDPFYYPRRVYGGTRVVFVSRPRLPIARYVFKDRTPTEPYVTTVRQRPVDASGRRVVDPGIGARAVGGVGRIPAPISTSSQSGRRAFPFPHVQSPPSTAQPTDAPGRRTMPDQAPQQSGPERRAVPAPSQSRQAPDPVLERRDPRRAPTSMPAPRRAIPTPTPAPARPDSRTQRAPEVRPEPRSFPQRAPEPQRQSFPQAPRRVEPPRSAPRAVPQRAPSPSSRPSPGRRGHG